MGEGQVLLNNDFIFVFVDIYRGKERIYVIDQQKQTTKSIIEVDKFIGVYENYVIYEKNNKIYKRLVTGDKLGRTKKLLSAKNSFNEICANWLFVYIEKNNKANELIRINLDNGEMVKEKYHRTEND